MAGLRVFVSSTCADLDAYRLQLRNLLLRMGYEPIMSDHSEVLYDPSLHTHASCLKDVRNADLVILLIGSRFGGTTVSEALPILNLDTALKASSSSALLDGKSKISITQAESLQAVQSEIPIFTFVDRRVYADHHVYITNKDNPVLKDIKFPSIAKQETAASIFEFINFLSHRSFNNAVVTFQSFSEIEDHLIKQWSLYFQRLIHEKREKADELRRSAAVVDRIEELKTLVLQTLPAGHGRDVARAVLNFRRLISFLLGVSKHTSPVDFAKFDGSFGDLLAALEVEDVSRDSHPNSPFLLVLSLSTGGFIGTSSFTFITLRKFLEKWEEFKSLGFEVKKAVIEAVSEAESGSDTFVKHSETVSEYHEERARRDDGAETPNELRRVRPITSVRATPRSTKEVRVRRPKE